MGLFKREDRDAVNWSAAVFALLAVIIAFAALITAANAEGDGGGAPSGAVQVALTEFAITPSNVSVPTDGQLFVQNNGAAPHNLTVEETDVKTKDLDPGESETLDVGSLEAGSYTIFCSIPGHREQGMVGSLTVGGAAGSASSGDQHATQHEGGSPEALLAENDKADETQLEPVTAYVEQLTEGANTKGVGNQILEPKVLADGTKQFDLTASIIDWEIEPGKTVPAWAYNEQVPGPWIKLDVGDKVRVVLKNELPQSTAIHFHGIETPFEMDGVPFITQDPIKPGKTFTYEFVADKPAFGIYHSHHHAEHQVPDGLLGIFQVGDVPVPEGMGPITQEIPMVLNDAGAIGLSLNGKSFPATAPVIAKVGETVAIHYANEGLQVHPMHLHGVPQLVVAKDGFPVPQPYYLDTLNVAPGERYTVLARPEARHVGPNNTPGIWAFHCHILTHAETESGMRWMVTTFIVNPA